MQTEFVTCLCNSCSGKIEFERASFDPEAPAVVACPHCGSQTQLYIPESFIRAPEPPSLGGASTSPVIPQHTQRSPSSATAVPPPVLPAKARTFDLVQDVIDWFRRKKGENPLRWLARLAIVGWSVLCFDGVAFGVFLTIRHEADLTPFEVVDRMAYPDASAAASVLGLGCGLAMWLIVWAAVALPAGLIWAVSKGKPEE